MENYALLLAEETRIPVTEIAPALGQVLDRPPGEVTRRLRECPWILLDSVPADRLDRVFEILGAANVKAKAVPVVHMPALPRALRVRTADVMEKGFFLMAAEPPAPPFVSWDSLWIVSAGNVTVTSEESGGFLGSAGAVASVGAPFGSDLRSRGPTPGSAPLSSGRRRSEDHLLVDLVFEGEPGWQFRIDGGDFSYDCLKDEMGTSSRDNLKLLLMRIRERAPQALFTQRTLAFLSGEPSATFRFRSLASFEAHNLWTVQSASDEE